MFRTTVVAVLACALALTSSLQTTAAFAPKSTTLSVDTLKKYHVAGSPAKERMSSLFAMSATSSCVSANRDDQLMALKQTLQDEINRATVEDDDEPSTERSKAMLLTAAPAKVLIDFPSKDMTGVDANLLEVCATISDQISKAKKSEDFKLCDANHTAEVILFANHGELLKDTVPPFVIVKSGDALILGWRGSTTIMDWTSDLTFAPVSSPRWSSVAPQIRCHSAYTALRLVHVRKSHFRCDQDKEHLPSYPDWPFSWRRHGTSRPFDDSRPTQSEGQRLVRVRPTSDMPYCGLFWPHGCAGSRQVEAQQRPEYHRVHEDNFRQLL
jgi:hypothetical protein